MSSGKSFLKVTDKLACFQQHYLDSEDILRFKKDERLNNCIVDLFFGSCNNWAFHHWQTTWEHSNCFFPAAFAQMLGAHAWLHTIQVNNEPKISYIDGREDITIKISKKFTGSIDLFKFKKCSCLSLRPAIFIVWLSKCIILC